MANFNKPPARKALTGFGRAAARVAAVHRVGALHVGDAAVLCVASAPHRGEAFRACRLAIANDNVPNMVGQISTCLAEAKLNIADLLNKSRGDVAYTLLDTDAPIAPEVVVKLRAIPGVLSARLI